MIYAEKVSYCLSRKNMQRTSQVDSMTKINRRNRNLCRKKPDLTLKSLIWVDTVPFIEWCCLGSFIGSAAMVGKKTVNNFNSSYQTNRAHIETLW